MTAPNPPPRLNERALGWLNFLYQKATTADNWSEDGEPHEWWDRTSTHPMCSFPRFDLQESTYAIGLMADQTPAWREVYTEILDEIAERFLTYWAAVDWLSQFGADPDRKNYPPEWKGTLIPEQFWGDYDAPGWTANGIAPWGLQPDPIGADGNLFFKGWLNLTQALYSYVSGVDKWASPFMMAGVDRARFEWTQHQLVDHLVGQWAKTPMGPHCENTKAWPFCLSAAGLGLQMYDNVFDKKTHHAYHAWLEHTRDVYYGFNDQGGLDWVTLYYDAQKDHNHVTAPPTGLALAFYSMPQDPAFAERLYRGAVAFMQWDNPKVPIMVLNDPRVTALGLTAAKEFGDYAVEARLRAHAEQHFEPRFFGLNDSQFGYWFNFGENWPRGQISALAICAEVGEPGAWVRMFREPNLDKFSAPSVYGIDYPALGVSQAWHDDARATLHVRIFDANRGKTGAATTFRVSQIPDLRAVKVLCDGQPFDRFKVTEAGDIEIHTDIAEHYFEIHTGFYRRAKTRDAIKTATEAAATAPPRAAARRGGATSRLIATPMASCACCV